MRRELKGKSNAMSVGGRQGRGVLNYAPGREGHVQAGSSTGNRISIEAQRKSVPSTENNEAKALTGMPEPQGLWKVVHGAQAGEMERWNKAKGEKLITRPKSGERGRRKIRMSRKCPGSTRQEHLRKKISRHGLYTQRRTEMRLLDLVVRRSLQNSGRMGQKLECRWPRNDRDMCLQVAQKGRTEKRCGCRSRKEE